VDVTLVELSAFDTVLSPPQLPQQEPKARAVIAPPVEHRVQVRQPKREEKRIEVKDPPRLKTAPKPHADTAEAAAPSTTTSAASLGGGNDVTQKARISYHHMVATLLAKAKRYPERAVRGHVTGSGSVRLTISAAGSVKSLEVATSTQSTILDDELLRMVERAAPFPSFPSDMTQSDVTLLVPVSFRLES
jgi:protein TonB